MIRTELNGEASTPNIVRDTIKISYLGAYVKLGKAAVSYAVCLSFCSHGTTRLQLEGLS